MLVIINILLLIAHYHLLERYINTTRNVLVEDVQESIRYSIRVSNENRAILHRELEKNTEKILYTVLRNDK